MWADVERELNRAKANKSISSARRYKKRSPPSIQPCTVVLMMGLPGSGKTTMAKKLVAPFEEGDKGLIISADDYWEENGIPFDGALLDKAHDLCKTRCQLALDEKKYLVIVIDNTNLQLEHMLPYVKMAKAAEWSTKVVEPDTSWRYEYRACAEKNKHKVPFETIRRMGSKGRINLETREQELLPYL